MKNLIIIFIAIFAVSCTKKIPQDAQCVTTRVSIYPDYTDIVIPYNIAPLNFMVKESGKNFITVSYSTVGKKIVAKGNKIQWNINKWHQLLEQNKGDTLHTTIYVKKNKQWIKFPTIKNYIANDKIDDYFSYRLIEPGYNVYEILTINQRNLTNFKKKIIYNNSFLSKDEDGQCINCHAFQDYNRSERMQFHIRQFKGGTVIVLPEGIKKVDLNTDSTISAGVYPAWHPHQNLIAYSVNNISQHFPKNGKEKVEVQDSHSGLILYDIDKNKISIIQDDSSQLETFPSWSPDGKYLYYVSAKFPETANPNKSLVPYYKDFHYNIYRKAFNNTKHTFSIAEKVFDAEAIGKSATFPRISPNGNYLLFTLADYGTFHIWHKSSDLQLLDLKSGNTSTMAEINSNDSESYHAWSSNSHWIIFSSRRDDGSYTRPYISYFNNDKANKPFIVPQKDPNYYFSLFKSYNIPEFIVKPISTTKKQLIKAINKEAERAEFQKILE